MSDYVIWRRPNFGGAHLLNPRNGRCLCGHELPILEPTVDSPNIGEISVERLPTCPRCLEALFHDGHFTQPGGRVLDHYGNLRTASSWQAILIDERFGPKFLAAVHEDGLYLPLIIAPVSDGGEND